MENFEALKKRRWAYLTVGTVLFLFLGLIYAWNVFRAPLEDEFGWTSSQMSMTFSISITLYCFGVMAGGVITKHKGHRLALLLCAVCLCVGFVLSSRVSTLAGIYISYGVLCGFGVGVGYNALISTMIAWFPERPGFASGVVLMGYGFGAMVLGTTSAKMMEIWGWRATFAALGVLLAVVVTAMALFVKEAPDGFAEVMAEHEENVVPSIEEIGPREMVKRRNFWIYFLWATAFSAAGLAVLNDTAQFAQSVIGGDLTRAAAVAGTVSIFNGIGRVIGGLVYDRFGYRVTMFATDTLFICAGGLLIFSMTSHSFAVLAAAFIATGLGYGFLPAMNPAFMAHFFGRKNYSVNFSLLCLNPMIASYLGPLCGGGDYMRTFISVIGFAVAGFVLTVMIKRPARVNM